MPSLFKKLLYGKELSNPYLNRYHPGHRASPSEPTHHIPNRVAQAPNPQPTSLDPSTRMPPRSVSPTYLEEARRLAGRDAVTGRPVQAQSYASYAAVSGQSISPTGRGNPQPSRSSHLRASEEENPYVTGGDAAMGRGGWSGQIRDRVTQDQTQTPKANVENGTRHDVVVREERRKMIEEERAQAERLREREIGGYFAPERPVVREYYGGA